MDSRSWLAPPLRDILDDVARLTALYQLRHRSTGPLDPDAHLARAPRHPVHPCIDQTVRLAARGGQTSQQPFEIGQTLQLIICHQIDLVVYKDTNNEECYKFECAIKV